MKAPSEEIYGKSTQGIYCWKVHSLVTTLSLTIQVYLYSFFSYLPNLRNPAKFSENSNFSSRLSKVTDLGANGKRVCNFILVININFRRISPTVSEILTNVQLENSLFFSGPTIVWRPCDINVIYTQLKSIMGCTIPSLTIRVYLHSFSRCWLPNLWNPVKFRENSNL